MVQPVSTPFSAKPVRPVKFDIPPDLSNLVAASEHVRRLSHPDYPQGMRADNVKTHTIRLVHSGLTLDLPAKFEPIRPDLVRILWIHDLPEVPNAAATGQDVSAVSMHDDPALAQSVEASELLAARQLFSPSNLQHFADFESARHLLNGSGPASPAVPHAALIARILDICEGDTGFYYFLTAWVTDDTFDGTMPTSRPYEFTLARYQALEKRLHQIKSYFDPALAAVCFEVLYDQMAFIVQQLSKLRQSHPRLMIPAAHKLMTDLPTAP